MKKLLSILPLIIFASLLLPLTAHAAGKDLITDDISFETGKAISYVTDETGTLAASQIGALNEKASIFEEKRKCGIYIWIVDLVPEEYAKSTDDMEVYAEAFYKRNGLGCGGDKNGMLLLLEIGDVPGERDYLLYTNGSVTLTFNNGKRERLLDNKIVPLFTEAFGSGNFYKVADSFIDAVENEFVTDFIITLALKLIAVIAVPSVIAWLICRKWKRGMKTAVTAHSADNYIPNGGFKLTGKTDRFLYRTSTRVKIERESSSSSGGSASSSSGKSSGGKV